MIGRMIILTTLMMMIVPQPLYAHIAAKALPDLKVRQFLFPPSADKALRVQVANYGKADAGACFLYLTVRRINGVSVGRTTRIKLSPIQAKQTDWVVIDASSILPKSVALEDTTFRLNVDATEVVGESDESNNLTWHNLEAATKEKPDLKVKQFLFSQSKGKAMKVQVVNYGKANAGPSVLRLTVRRINGVAVARMISVKLPSIASLNYKWVVIDASSILPNNVALEDTTFRLDADASKSVNESDETNNLTWHNL